jgi:hypothetical protein
MHRHPWVSVSTIVAMMAAHRAASGIGGAATAFCEDEIARIGAFLRTAVEAASPEGFSVGIYAARLSRRNNGDSRGPE